MVNVSLAGEKISSVEEVSGHAKKLQTELQTLYLKLKTADGVKKSGAGSPQKKLMTSMEVYNRVLSKLCRDSAKETGYSVKQWEELDALLGKVREKATMKAVSNDLGMLRSVNGWVRNAESFGAGSEKYAVRTNQTQSNPSQPILTQVGGHLNGNLNLVVEDYSLGLNTPQDRVAFVEELTRQRAYENEIFARSRGRYTTLGGYPRNYPSAYIYGNGSYGNRTNFGRRDSLIPLYNNQRQPVRIQTAPRLQIIIK